MVSCIVQANKRTNYESIRGEREESTIICSENKRLAHFFLGDFRFRLRVKKVVIYSSRSESFYSCKFKELTSEKILGDYCRLLTERQTTHNKVLNPLCRQLTSTRAAPPIAFPSSTSVRASPHTQHYHIPQASTSPPLCATQAE